jgi:hypothetical protein
VDPGGYGEVPGTEFPGDPPQVLAHAFPTLDLLGILDLELNGAAVRAQKEVVHDPVAGQARRLLVAMIDDSLGLMSLVHGTALMLLGSSDPSQ